MPTNKNAYIRYQALDKCFRDRLHRYYIDDLIDKCEDALLYYNGVGGVSRRQIFEDIKFMESDTGWSIPLERRKDGKKVYYRYKDSNFSINKQPQLKLSTGIVYRYAGYHQNDNSIFPDHTTYPGYTYSEYISSHAVFIPLRINLDFPLNTLWTISLLTGPQFSFKWENLIHQNVQTTPTTKTTFEGGLFSPYDIIPADCTWGAGLTVKYKRLFLQTVFDIGLFNRNTEAFVNLINHINPIYSRELTVSIGYEF